MDTIAIYLSNTLSEGKKERFEPINKEHVRMYVCGPTVYDRPHLGNARSAVAYDLLYRLLRAMYPKVTYARNLTDVDDKIIEASIKTNTSIRDVATKFTKIYRQDIGALQCLNPDHEPKATEHIAEMIVMIQKLIDLEYAYESDGNVMFAVSKYKNYGTLSNKSLNDLIAGARVQVESYKHNAADFVLWKPVAADAQNDEGFESPWGLGRPGWHIECSAMSKALLGDTFDIHGGGADLKFPHHENEIAQSCAANGTDRMANYWVHNGFLTVQGEKMSKSLNNFTTVRDVLDNGFEGPAIRLFYLTTHYKKPIDFSDKAISDAKKAYNRFVHVMVEFLSSGGDVASLTQDSGAKGENITFNQAGFDQEALEYLADDLNTPKILALAHKVAHEGDAKRLHSILSLVGFDIIKSAKDLKENFVYDENAADVSRETSRSSVNTNSSIQIPQEVVDLAKRRVLAKQNKSWQEADMLRDRIYELGYEIKDLPDHKYEISKI